MKWKALCIGLPLVLLLLLFMSSAAFASSRVENAGAFSTTTTGCEIPTCSPLGAQQGQLETAALKAPITDTSATATIAATTTATTNTNTFTAMYFGGTTASSEQATTAAAAMATTATAMEVSVRVLPIGAVAYIMNTDDVTTTGNEVTPRDLVAGGSTVALSSV
jgi:hypothetical protein